MKKYSLSVICVVLFALLAGCGSKETSNITVDYGDSAVYTEQDMDDAIKVIEEMIGSWEGCELHSISYSSDDVCTDEKNLSWMNDLEKANDNDLVFTQCIMFDSSFRSPKEGGGAWEPDTEYTWSWWLAVSYTHLVCCLRRLSGSWATCAARRASRFLTALPTPSA